MLGNMVQYTGILLNFMAELRVTKVKGNAPTRGSNSKLTTPMTLRGDSRNFVLIYVGFF